VWDIGYKVGSGMQKFYDANDGIPETIHDYEANVIAIHALTNALKSLPTVCEEIIIVDGNMKYANNLSEWQVKPKQSTVLKIDGSFTRNQTVKAMTL
jgi:2-C-methyl-D-erythritol 4-phosphate cytidylyltransferase